MILLKRISVFASCFSLCMGAQGYAKESSSEKIAKEETPSARCHSGALRLRGEKISYTEIMGPTSLSKVQADHSLTVTGPFEGEDCHLSDLKVVGPVKMKGTTLKGLDVTGPVKVDGVTVEETASIVGPLLAKNATFKKDLHLQGPLKVKDSTFEGNIILELSSETGNKKNKSIVTLSQTKGKELLIKVQSGSNDSPVKVIVKEKSSCVKITFEGTKNGLVIADASSVVSEVVGGTLKKKS